MRVLVCGGRDFDDAEFLFAALDLLHAGVKVTCIIEGEAPGADRLARKWAEARGIRFEPYRPDWEDIFHPDAVIRYRKDGSAYDATAGIRRNTRMLDEGRPECVVAFPGGTGTKNMIDQAKKRGLEIIRPASRSLRETTVSSKAAV